LGKKPVLIVMDYAFGEQAYETIDELLKPFKKGYFTECGIFLYGKRILKVKEIDMISECPYQ
jgi:hypothetical protein